MKVKMCKNMTELKDLTFLYSDFLKKCNQIIQKENFFFEIENQKEFSQIYHAAKLNFPLRTYSDKTLLALVSYYIIKKNNHPITLRSWLGHQNIDRKTGNARYKTFLSKLNLRRPSPDVEDYIHAISTKFNLSLLIRTYSLKLYSLIKRDETLFATKSAGVASALIWRTCIIFRHNFSQKEICQFVHFSTSYLRQYVKCIDLAIRLNKIKIRSKNKEISITPVNDPIPIRPSIVNNSPIILNHNGRFE